METSSSKKYMLIEHMEEYLYEWCKDEYIQVLKYLKNSKEFTPILSNFNQISQFETFKSKSKDDIEDNKKNLKELIDKNNEQTNNFMMVSNEINDEKHFENEGKIKFQTENKQELEFETKRVCLLDLRATEILSPKDTEEFDLFIFGGILGDHPPRDRTKQLRNPKFVLRHLEDVQFSTDTALLVSKLIIENKREFKSLPFVNEPSVSSKNSDIKTDVEFQLEGFRYLKDVYDLEKADIDSNKETDDFLMSKNIREQMLTKDLDFNLM